MNRILRTTLAIAALLAPIAAQAQYESDTGEVAIYSGGTFGGGAHPFIGGSAGLEFNKYALGLIDVSFTNLDNHSLRYISQTDIKNSHLYDFNYSIHIRYPINERWAPYGIAGPSVVWNGYTYGSIGANGVHLRTSADNVNFGFHTGAGVRFNVTDEWGIRPEVKVVITARTYVVFSLGFFFKTPGGI